MCTVTIFRDTNGYTMTMNRDERRSRGETPPQQRIFNGISCEYPVDTQAGGTWFGTNELGLTIGLLNKYQVALNPAAKTRGGLIPKLLACGAFDSAVRQLEALNLSNYNAFDLILCGPDRSIQFSWDRQTLRRSNLPSSGWYFWTSSSVDFPAVDRYRRQFFEQWQQAGAVNTVVEDVHLWQSNNRSYSINMSRANAHSKSICQVAFPLQSRIAYTPVLEPAMAVCG